VTSLLESLFLQSVRGHPCIDIWKRQLVEHLREFLRHTYDLETVNIVVEQPPKIEFGEYALPLAFELVRKTP